MSTHEAFYRDFYALVHPDARIGEHVKLSPGVVIGPNVVLEDHVYVGPCTIIGSWAELHGVDPRTAVPGKVIIGKYTTIREHVTIHGSGNVAGATTIGRNCHIQAHAHIGHDAELEDDVTVACYGCIGGHARVGRQSNIGLHAVLHQFAEVPPGCMVGANSFVKGKDLMPYTTYVGSPAKAIGANHRLVARLLKPTS